MIFASGLKYIGVATTVLGWILCAVLLTGGVYWLFRTQPWRNGNGKPAAANGAEQANANSSAGAAPPGTGGHHANGEHANSQQAATEPEASPPASGSPADGAQAFS